jgi:PadR family transcriptional regulator PadR
VDDANTANKKFQKELNSGTAALVLLGVLGRAPEPMYGYQIVKHIEKTDRDIPMMKHGALYPVLRALESSGLLDSRVEPSVSGPPRRYYSITGDGRNTLHRWIEIWNETKVFVNNVLEGTENG